MYSSIIIVYNGSSLLHINHNNSYIYYTLGLSNVFYPCRCLIHLPMQKAYWAHFLDVFGQGLSGLSMESFTSDLPQILFNSFAAGQLHSPGVSSSSSVVYSVTSPCVNINMNIEQACIVYVFLNL